MNRNKRAAFLVILLMTMTFVSAQVNIGLRDNQYVKLGYAWHQRWSAQLEHSVFSQAFKTQYLRFILGYECQWDNLSFKASPYYGFIYNGDFYNAGLFLDGCWQVLKRLSLEGCLNPHYDSGYDYETCFMVGAGVYLYKDISAVIQYSTIPEYRMKEKRVKLGLRFGTSKLCVWPMLSIPVDNSSGKHVRLLCGFEYKFW